MTPKEFLDEYYSITPNQNDDKMQANKEDHLVLLNLIEEFGVQSVFEIGSYKGYTAQLLGTYPKIKRVKTIDPNHDVICKTPVEFEKINSDGYKVKDGEQYDMVFIDGEHTANAVRSDRLLALALRAKVIVYHDADLPEINSFLTNETKAKFMKGDCLLAYERIKRVIWYGPLFNPTGISTANREIVREMIRQGAEVQAVDPWSDRWEFNKGLEFLNRAINNRFIDATIFADYPQFWHAGYGKVYGFFLHEGSLLHGGWADNMNKVDKVFVPSKATRNLFKTNEVIVPIEVINYGTDPEIYKPAKEAEYPKNDEYIFLSVNSWTGQEGDRKGTDLLIKAFDEEFKPEEKVKLILKIGTFWDKKDEEFYMDSTIKILGHRNPNIFISAKYMTERELVAVYHQSDCFVMPTRGEAFGLTALNAMAVGLPLIITKDNNAGHMDFTKVDSVLFVNAPTVKQGDLRFFAEGNMLAEPDLADLKKQMRFAFDNGEMLRKKGLDNVEAIHTKFSWAETARKLLEAI